MREEIEKLLTEKFPEIDFNESSTLVDDEILDSFKITQIVALLSKTYKISIPFSEIKNENLNSLDAITAMVERIKNG